MIEKLWEKKGPEEEEPAGEKHLCQQALCNSFDLSPTQGPSNATAFHKFL